MAKPAFPPVVPSGRRIPLLVKGQGRSEQSFLLQRVQPAFVSITLGGAIIVSISAAIGSAA